METNTKKIMKKTFLIIILFCAAYLSHAQKFINSKGDTITIKNLNTNPQGYPAFGGFDFEVKEKPRLVSNVYKGIIPFDNYQKNIDSLIQSINENPTYQQIIYALFMDALDKGKIKVNKDWRLIIK